MMFAKSSIFAALNNFCKKCPQLESECIIRHHLAVNFNELSTNKAEFVEVIDKLKLSMPFAHCVDTIVAGVSDAY